MTRADQSRSSSLPIAGGQFEASGVVAVPGAPGALFVDDGSPRQVFWLPFGENGVAAAASPVDLGIAVPDPEGITTDGTFFYVVGSQSQGGARNGAGLVRFRFDPRTRQATQVEVVRGLRRRIESQVTGLAAIGRGRSRVIDIEGLTWDAARRRLLLGLRSPLAAGRRAIVVSATLVEQARPLSAENLRFDPDLIEVNLGGLAIRALSYDPIAKRILVIGGSATDDPKAEARLFEWDGISGSVVRDVALLNGAEKPEGVTRIMIGGRSRTLVVFDSGRYQLLEP